MKEEINNMSFKPWRGRKHNRGFFRSNNTDLVFEVHFERKSSFLLPVHVLTSTSQEVAWLALADDAPVELVAQGSCDTALHVSTFSKIVLVDEGG